MNKFLLPLLIAMVISLPHSAQNASSRIIFEDVRIFDSEAMDLLPSMHVLVEGNIIKTVSQSPIQGVGETKVIDGSGKTLIPGLIDVHVHMVFGNLSVPEMMSSELSEEMIMQKVSTGAKKMLLRGFTSVRDAGGPIFPLKTAIDRGAVWGPRIWPSGATISQTSGHGDFRTPRERSRRFFGEVSRAEQLNATFIADGVPEVLTATRENLRQGASQIKIMAGGGTSSSYDPIDVTQYTFEEMKAAVDAAEDWGTYVMAHAYTPRAVQRAIKAGVKSIEHGQLLDEETIELIAEKGVWLSLQNLVDETPDMDSLRKIKRKPVLEGQPKVWGWAKKHRVKIAWGTDFLFEPELNEQQNDYILRLKQWFSNAEILKMITYDNAQLLQLSGLRSPYQGKLGVIEQGALADLILVDGNPLEDLSLLADPEGKFAVIMKGGIIYQEQP